MTGTIWHTFVEVVLELGAHALKHAEEKTSNSTRKREHNVLVAPPPWNFSIIMKITIFKDADGCVDGSC